MEENKKTTELKKPETTAAEFYADAKQTITLGVRNLIRAFPLPLFMIESILQGLLLEYKNEAYMELASCLDEHKQKMEEYYEAKIKEMQEAFEEEKEELVTLFENPDLQGTTPEGEPKPNLEGKPEPDPEEKTVIEKKYIGGETVVEEVE